MAMRTTRRGLDRWVTPGAQKMLVGMAVFGLLVAACWVPLYFFADSRDTEIQGVDLPALQARAAREQPVGGTEAETLTFLRSLGFENDNIRLKRYADTGRLAEINGWIALSERPNILKRARAHCSFDEFARLDTCSIWEGMVVSSSTSPYFIETTPAPTR